jgi:DNA-binding transcriptional MerR regulator
MLSIGEFARHGRVSVRMLRHYDAIGLLRPAFIDPGTGYRYYQAGQFATLNRVIALKELGFALEQVQAILEESVSAAELRGMLRLRRAEIRSRIEAETARLARVEARLLTIEDEASTSAADAVVVTRLEAVRVAELTGVAPGYEPQAITPVIQPLYRDLWCRLVECGLTATGPALAFYEDAAGDAGAVVVHAGVPVGAAVDETSAVHSLRLVDLPEVESAAVIVHHGSMDRVLSTVQALARWIDANGYRCVGYAREVTLEWSEDRGKWVTELQQPISASGG